MESVEAVESVFHQFATPLRTDQTSKLCRDEEDWAQSQGLKLSIGTQLGGAQLCNSAGGKQKNGEDWCDDSDVKIFLFLISGVETVFFFCMDKSRWTDRSWRFSAWEILRFCCFHVRSASWRGVSTDFFLLFLQHLSRAWFVRVCCASQAASPASASPASPASPWRCYRRGWLTARHAGTRQRRRSWMRNNLV